MTSRQELHLQPKQDYLRWCLDYSFPKWPLLQHFRCTLPHKYSYISIMNILINCQLGNSVEGKSNNFFTPSSGIIMVCGSFDNRILAFTTQHCLTVEVCIFVPLLLYPKLHSVVIYVAKNAFKSTEEIILANNIWVLICFNKIDIMIRKSEVKTLFEVFILLILIRSVSAKKKANYPLKQNELLLLLCYD
ncbi:hypothetical protein EGR_03255 [Echinococcus granulosus]|uniref:Uncharacterized protein n=1 Tax=Echinococcus granulosus TaxID=6210 RepID=W6UUF1_ECHGR|nr:hypothetical protein EGR_03255 [Echinococcus granulosus]EUB61982.1 hypothetical protein EGR_03255 [Echinococcus granulosus]